MEEQLPDLRNIHIDRKLDIKKRAENFIKEAKTPYSFHIGDVDVNIKMSSEGKSFQEAFFNAVFSGRE